MRRLVSSVMIVTAIMVLGHTGVSESRPARQDVPAHPLAGHWRVTSEGGSPGEPSLNGIYTFSDEGTILVVIQSRLNGTSSAELVSWGTGAWEPEGEFGARYTVTWPMMNQHGVTDRTVTVDGKLNIENDGVTFANDRRESLVMVRNETGIVHAVYGANPSEMTALVVGAVIRPRTPQSSQRANGHA